MQYSHALSLLGGVVGAGIGASDEVSVPAADAAGNPLSQDEKDRRSLAQRAGKAAFLGFLGSKAGRGVGNIVDVLTKWFAVRDLTARLKEYPEMTRAHLRRLIRYAPKDLPIYLQTKGSLDNAFYTDSDTLPLDGSWTDARTGKAVKGIPQGRGVYIGKDFKYAPILAHELGHASSMERHGGGTGVSTSFYTGLGSVGLLVAAGLSFSKWRRGGGKGWLYGAAGLSAAGLGAGIVSDAFRTREERRASDTAAAYLLKLKGLSQAQREQGLDLLSRAYRTYSPLQLGPAYRPDASRALL